jgi:hypothetical protein
MERIMARRVWAIMLSLSLIPTIVSSQTVSGSLRIRGESWSWFETPAADGSYAYAGALARVALSHQGKAFGWRVEAAVPLLLGLPDDAVAPAPAGQLGAGASYWQASDSAENTASIFIKQAYVRFGRPAGQSVHTVRLGRFEFTDGSEFAAKNPIVAAVKRDRIAHRLIGNFGWTHVQRSLDGVHYAFDGPSFNVTALATRPTRGVFDVDGMENLDVGLAYGAVSGALSNGVADWRLFGIYYRDYREDPRPLKVDNRPAVIRAADLEDVGLATFGGHYVRALNTGAGAVDVLLWGALQTGNWGQLDHSAHAFSVEAGLQPEVLQGWKPWVRAGYFRSSGDDDAADGAHRTFFQIAPTPRIYARFPFYNLMNLRDAWLSLSVRPGARLTVRSEVHQLNLSESADLWYLGGGAFEPETFGYAGRPSNGEEQLATTFDISADFRVSDHLSVNAYAAFASGGDVVNRIYTGSEARLFYLEMELRK